MFFYLRHYRERGTPLTALYPFRPDFYRSMGFGFGTKVVATGQSPPLCRQRETRHTCGDWIRPTAKLCERATPATLTAITG